MSGRQDPRDGCRCEGGHEGPEHRALVARVDRSFEQDRDRAILGERVATSEALRLRASAHMNGHNDRRPRHPGQGTPRTPDRRER